MCLEPFVYALLSVFCNIYMCVLEFCYILVLVTGQIYSSYSFNYMIVKLYWCIRLIIVNDFIFKKYSIRVSYVQGECFIRVY